MRVSLLTLFLLFFVRCSLASVSAQPSFHRDIAPLVLQNCAPCHHEGGSAPFSLQTYSEVKRRSVQIGQVVQKHFMPPLPLKSDATLFHDAYALSDAQRALLVQWVKLGGQEGKRKEAGKPLVEPQTWRLGVPSAVVTLAKPYTLFAEAGEVFRAFVLPSPFAEDRWIRATDIKFLRPQVVRHALLLVDESGSARKLEAQSGGVGFSAFMGGVMGEPQSLIEFAPGILPRFLPTNSAFFLKKATDLVLLLRFHPDGKREEERPQIALYVAPKPPDLPAIWARLGARELNLQPGKKATLTDTWELSAGAHLLQLVPRLHAACIEVKVTATLPDGKALSLLNIAPWDSNWHRPFVFKTPLKLPPKTRISLECRFDNTPESAYSRRQTRPHIIMPGLECMEEMASLWLLLTSQTAADSEALAQSAKRVGSKPQIIETGKYLRAPRN